MSKFQIPVNGHDDACTRGISWLWVPMMDTHSHTGRFCWMYRPVDACIAPYVDQLIAKGVWTTGCCCGHKAAQPSIADGGMMPSSFAKLRPAHPGSEMEILVLPEILEDEIRGSLEAMTALDKDKAKKRVKYAMFTAAGWLKFSFMVDPETASRVKELLDERRFGGDREDELCAILSLGAKFRWNVGNREEKISGGSDGPET